MAKSELLKYIEEQKRHNDKENHDELESYNDNGKEELLTDNNETLVSLNLSQQHLEEVNRSAESQNDQVRINIAELEDQGYGVYNRYSSIKALDHYYFDSVTSYKGIYINSDNSLELERSQQHFVEINYFYLRYCLRRLAQKNAVAYYLLQETEQADNEAIKKDQLNYAQALEALYMRMWHAREHSEAVYDRLTIYDRVTNAFARDRGQKVVKEKPEESRKQQELEFESVTLDVIRQARLKCCVETYLGENKSVLLQADPKAFYCFAKAIRTPYQTSLPFETELARLATNTLPDSQTQVILQKLEPQFQSIKTQLGTNIPKVTVSSQQDVPLWQQPLVYRHCLISLNHSRQESVAWLNKMLRNFENKNDAILFLFRHYQAIIGFSSCKSTLSLEIEHRLVTLLEINLEDYQDACNARNKGKRQHFSSTNQEVRISKETDRLLNVRTPAYSVKSAEVLFAEAITKLMGSRFSELEQLNCYLRELHNFIVQTEVSSTYKVLANMGHFFAAAEKKCTRLQDEMEFARQLIYFIHKKINNKPSNSQLDLYLQEMRNKISNGYLRKIYDACLDNSKTVQLDVKTSYNHEVAPPRAGATPNYTVLK